MSSFHSNTTTRKNKSLKQVALQNSLIKLDEEFEKQAAELETSLSNKRNIDSISNESEPDPAQISNKRNIGSISNESEPDPAQIIYMTNTLRVNPQYVSNEQYVDTINHLKKLKPEISNLSAQMALQRAILSLSIDLKRRRKMTSSSAGGKPKHNKNTKIRTRSKRITRKRR